MTFTKEDVLRAMREAVEEKGADHIYEPPRNEFGLEGACAYTARSEDGSLVPGCLVGDVINRLSPETLPHLAYADRGYAGVPAQRLRAARILPPDFWDEEAEMVAREAQAFQDYGRPWGEALAAAERRSLLP